MLSGEVEFSLGFNAGLIWRARNERGCKKLSWGQRISQTHLALNTSANGRSSRGNGLDEELLPSLEFQMVLSCHPDDSAKICSRRSSFSEVLRSSRRVLDIDFSHRNIFIQGRMPMLLV